MLNHYSKFIIKYTGVLLALGTTITVLWGMLLPGYVLTLDMVFAPWFHFGTEESGFQNLLPLWHMVSFLYSLFPGWVVQKIILFALKLPG